MDEFEEMVDDLLKDSGGLASKESIENVLLLLGRRWRRKDSNFTVYYDIGILRNEEKLYGRSPSKIE